MAEPRPAHPATIEAPAPWPLELEARATPQARDSDNHLSGAVTGGTITYTDLYSFTWYTAGGGMLTTNRGQRRPTRTAHDAGKTRGRRRR